jgi:hypothetical protein
MPPKINVSWVLEAHAYNLVTLEAEIGGIAIQVL